MGPLYDKMVDAIVASVNEKEEISFSEEEQSKIKLISEISNFGTDEFSEIQDLIKQAFKSDDSMTEFISYAFTKHGDALPFQAKTLLEELDPTKEKILVGGLPVAEKSISESFI
jgi:hypothetical protein